MQNTEQEQLTPELVDSAEETQTDVTEQEAQATDTESEELPEKFKGKSAAEIARSAIEAEKRMHDMSQDASSARRLAEQTQVRLMELQNQLSQRQQVQETEPNFDFDKEWDEDPKQAIKKELSRQEETLAQRERRLALEMRSKEGVEFYNQEKANNPDFAQREADMVKLSKEFGHLINPEYSNSKDVMRVLHLMAKGANISEYEKSAVERSKKQQDKIKEEKRAAVSERSGAVSTSNVESSDMDAFASMSEKQQQEELDRLLQKLGGRG